MREDWQARAEQAREARQEREGMKKTPNKFHLQMEYSFSDNEVEKVNLLTGESSPESLIVV